MFRGIAAPKFQENRFVLSNVIECDHLTAVFYRNIISKFDFQTNILKEIHNN